MVHSGMQRVRALEEEGVRGKVAKCKVQLLGGVLLRYSTNCHPLPRRAASPNVQAAALHRIWFMKLHSMVANPICHLE